MEIGWFLYLPPHIHHKIDHMSYILLGSTLQMKIYEGGCPSRMQAHWWPTRPMQDRQVWSQWLRLKVWSGLVWLLKLPRSSSCGVSFWGWPCRSPQRLRRLSGWCGTRPDGQKQVLTTGGGHCGKYQGSSWGSLYNVSLVALCHGRVQHTGLSWAGDAPLHFSDISYPA